MEKNSIYIDLAKVQGEIRNAPFDCENAFQKYKYASLSSVLDTVRPVLSKYGFCFIQVIEEVEGNVYLVTKLCHSSGEIISTTMPLYFDRLVASKNPWHERGAAITYARRYSLCSLLGINGDEDKDAEGFQEAKATITKAQTKILEGLLKKVDEETNEKFFAHYNINDLNDMPAEKFVSAKTLLEKKVSQVEGAKNES